MRRRKRGILRPATAREALQEQAQVLRDIRDALPPMTLSHDVEDPVVSKDYKPPRSADELKRRYARGERVFTRARLNRADLTGANLSGIKLRYASLRRAKLRGANLVGADLFGASLEGASLVDAMLGGAILTCARLDDADLSRANLSRAEVHATLLNGVNFSHANLSYCNLGIGILAEANFTNATMTGAYLGHAWLEETVFEDVDLSTVSGLETVRHEEPSFVNLETLRRSEGRINETFLRECGFTDWEIAAAKLYDPALTAEQINARVSELRDRRAAIPPQLNPIFISYARPDARFAHALAKRLERENVRLWVDVRHSSSGPLREQLTAAIAHHPVFVLVLSERSVESAWVLRELTTVMELARKHRQHILCPVALDASWKRCAWPGGVKQFVKRYNVIDFSNCDSARHSKLDRRVRTLLDGIRAFYRAPVGAR